MGFLYNKIMKNFLTFLLLFFCALPLFAQEDFNYSAKIILRQDASAEIEERITFHTDSIINLPALKRIIDEDINLKKISIFINGKYVDFTQKPVDDKIHIDALVNPNLRIGKNSIVLLYTVSDVMQSGYNKDIFKWDLNLQDWPYQFNEGKILFKVDGNHIVKNTAIKIGKDVLPIEENKEFSLTPFLDKEISLDLSFEKGFFDNYSLTSRSLRSILNILPIFVTLFMIIYCYILWAKYGKDPKGPFVTEYAPPKGITSAFSKYLLNMKKPFDYSYFVLTLISLSLKGFIEISEYQGEICIKSLKGTDSRGLYEEDKLIYERLFAYSPKIIFSEGNATYVIDAIRALFIKMENKKNKFFTHNSWYAVAPCLLLLISFLLVFPLHGTWQILAVLCFTISLIAFVFFVILIKNISPELLHVYNGIMGFKQYMVIAESGRVKFSNPFDKDRLFCDNLDYAYAFGIGPGVLRQFSKKIDPYILDSINCLYRDRTVFILSALMEPLEL